MAEQGSTQRQAAQHGGVAQQGKQHQEAPSPLLLVVDEGQQVGAQLGRHAALHGEGERARWLGTHTRALPCLVRCAAASCSVQRGALLDWAASAAPLASAR